MYIERYKNKVLFFRYVSCLLQYSYNVLSTFILSMSDDDQSF